MSELIKALVAARKEIGGAVKDKVNPHFKSKYADLGAVIDAIKGPLEKHDLTFVQDIEADRVVTVLYHAKGESLRLAPFPIVAAKPDAQGHGSALTYARRYSLMTALGVPAEDDDGQAASKKPEAQEQTHEQAPRSQSTRVHTAASAEVTEEQKTKLRTIGNSLIDLVNEERENVSVDHAYTMWEMVEELDQEQLLWLSLYLDKNSRVLTRLKAIMVEERRKLRAIAAGSKIDPATEKTFA